jgi:hypothetical protein
MYYTTNPEFIEEVLSFWSTKPLEKARQMIQKYVYPNEASANALTWNNSGVWKKTVVYKNPLTFSFPSEHGIFIEQTISYLVPIDRLSGTVSARSHKESINILMLNLMHEIIIHKRSVEEAKVFYIKQFDDYINGKKSSYTEALLF